MDMLGLSADYNGIFPFMEVPNENNWAVANGNKRMYILTTVEYSVQKFL